MAERVPAEVFPPGEFVKDELEERGWTQADLAEILGRPPRLVSELIAGKRAVTPETARGLAAAFGTDPQLWMNLESAYQLSRVKEADSAVARRAKLFGRFPIKDLLRRRWVEPSNNIDVLEQRVMSFFGIPSLDSPVSFVGAARASAPPSVEQCAWFIRARQLAKLVTPAGKFSPKSFESALEKLHPIMEHVPELRHVPTILSESGIRLVVVEHISGTKIDGLCFWLDGSPVVALSLRLDRVDSFWFTLMHELGHMKNGDGKTEILIDSNLVGEGATPTSEKNESERLADQFAGDFLLSDKEARSFIARTKPLYSKMKIRGFASRIHVHPGIVVGRLQHMKEIPYSHNREMLEKVRETILPVTIADGYGSMGAI